MLASSDKHWPVSNRRLGPTTPNRSSGEPVLERTPTVDLARRWLLRMLFAGTRRRSPTMNQQHGMRLMPVRCAASNEFGFGMKLTPRAKDQSGTRRRSGRVLKRCCPACVAGQTSARPRRPNASGDRRRPSPAQAKQVRNDSALRLGARRGDFRVEEAYVAMGRFVPPKHKVAEPVYKPRYGEA